MTQTDEAEVLRWHDGTLSTIAIDQQIGTASLVIREISGEGVVVAQGRGVVGVSYSRVSANVKGSPLTLAISNNDKSESKIHEKFGAGVDYNLTPVFTVRAEWERYKMPDPLGDGTLHVDAALLSVLYHF